MAKETYKELEFPKGAASAVLSTMNSGVAMPKKRVNANGTKKKTGQTPKKK